MSYTHLTLEERKYLQKLLSEGYSQRKIAAILERSPSTISREIQRNRAKWKPHQKPDNPYWYNHWRAQNLYIRRRREQQRMALHPGTEAWEFIIAGLKQYWSPEAIAGRWHLEYPERKPLCVSTVYRYIKKSLFPKITPKTHLRRRGKRIQTRNANYNSIQPERIIPQWSEEIRQRARIGDWEGDTVYGGVGKGFLVTQVDRKSRFLRAGLLAKRDASLTKAVICQLLKDVPVKASVWTMGLNSLNSRLWKPNSILWSISRSRTNHGSAERTKTPMDCCVSSSQRAAISTLFRKSL